MIIKRERKITTEEGETWQEIKVETRIPDLKTLLADERIHLHGHDTNPPTPCKVLTKS